MPMSESLKLMGLTRGIFSSLSLAVRTLSWIDAPRGERVRWAGRGGYGEYFKVEVSC